MLKFQFLKRDSYDISFATIEFDFADNYNIFESKVFRFKRPFIRKSPTQETTANLLQSNNESI